MVSGISGGAVGGYDLGTAHGKIVFTSNADETIKKTKQSFTQGLDQLAGNLTRTFAPVTAFVGAGVLAFANFDEKLTEVEARTGATAEEMERVEAVAKEMGRTTVFSATDAADAMLQLLSSGSSLEETFTALKPVMDLAAAGKINLGFAADATTDILKQFELGVENSTVVVDALAKASGSSSATVTDLIQGFANVGPVASSFGLSVDETAAVLATFAEKGIKGAEAGTQLRSMLNNMTSDVPDTVAAWERLGTSFFDADGAARPLNDILEEINVGLMGMSDEERTRTITDLAGRFGQMGLSALLASQGIDPMLESMENAADAATVAEKQMESFKAQANQLKSSLELLMINVIGPLADRYLTPLIAKATEIVNRMSDWAEANPELAVKIGGLIAAVGLAGPVLGTFSWLLKGIGLLLSPAGLLIGGIILLVGWLSEQEGGFAGALSRAATTARQLVAILKFGLVTAIQWVGDKARAIAEGALNILNDILEKIKGVVEDIKGAVDEATSAVDNVLGLQEGTAGGVVGDVVTAGPFGLFKDILGFDSGGSIGAGQAALIGTGAQPELFVPNTSGTMIPNADKLLGGDGPLAGTVNIYANSYAEGRAAADGFQARMDEVRRNRG